MTRLIKVNGQNQALKNFLCGGKFANFGSSHFLCFHVYVCVLIASFLFIQFSLLCFCVISMLDCQILVSVCFLCSLFMFFGFRVSSVYVCKCSEYAYAYSWATHACSMYAHAYSCPRTLISFLYDVSFVLLTCFSLCLTYFHVLKSIQLWLFCFALFCLFYAF